MIAIPAGPEGLTAEWLTRALSGATDGATVCGFRSERLGDGMGLLGLLVRVELDYAGRVGKAPRSLVAKFPALSPESREICKAFHFYERELAFYSRLARQANVPVPACYYQERDPATEQFVLLLEDLGGLDRVDQVIGSSGEQIVRVATTIARLHAKYWNQVDDGSLDWLADFSDPVMGRIAQKNYQAALGPTLAALSDAFTEETRAIAEALGESIPALLSNPRRVSRTVVHGDLRADNLLFRSDGDVVVLDWQICGRGAGVFDLAYHMSQSVVPAVRRSVERDAVRAYHGALVDNGVRGYCFESCWDDYREAVLVGLLYPVTVCGGLDLSNDRAKLLGRMILERSLSAISDVDAAAMLPGLS